MKKKLTTIDKISKIVDEEVIKSVADQDCYYEFKKYNTDTKMVFVYRSPESTVPVEFSMLKDLEKRLQKEINPRIRMGIIYTERQEGYEEYNQLMEEVQNQVSE